VRAVLEGLAARFAAMHISPRDLERLQTLQGQMAQAYAERDYKRAARVHTQFNAALYAASGNQRLIGMLMQFSDYIEHSKIVSLSLPHRAEEIRREHEAMIEAIAAHDPDAAEAAARLHVENAQRAFFAETRLPARFLGAPAS
jgi:DNA-binding GntR family transcriptional regulator